VEGVRKGCAGGGAGDGIIEDGRRAEEREGVRLRVKASFTLLLDGVGVSCDWAAGDVAVSVCCCSWVCC